MERTSSHLITTRGEFHAALRLGFAAAAAAGSRELCLSDSDFADWPLGERDVVELLDRWAASSRRLTLLARTYDEVARCHPRWVAWRVRWSHIVSCRANAELEPGDMPCLLIAAGALCIRLSDTVHYRGRLSEDRADEILARDQFDAVLQRSQEAFPATVSGL